MQNEKSKDVTPKSHPNPILNVLRVSSHKEVEIWWLYACEEKEKLLHTFLYPLPNL